MCVRVYEPGEHRDAMGLWVIDWYHPPDVSRLAVHRVRESNGESGVSPFTDSSQTLHVAHLIAPESILDGILCTF